MIGFVVDSNIIFSTLLNVESRIADLLLNSSREFEFYAPSYLKEEIEKHCKKIKEAKKIDQLEFDSVRDFIYRKVNFITDSLIPFEVWAKAAQLVRDVDINDIAYVASSIYFDKKIWTGDKELHKGLRAKGFDKIILTEELYELRLAIRAKAVRN